MAKISWSTGWYFVRTPDRLGRHVDIFKFRVLFRNGARESRSLVRHGRVAGIIRGLALWCLLSHLGEDSSIQHHGKEGVTRRP